MNTRYYIFKKSQLPIALWSIFIFYTLYFQYKFFVIPNGVVILGGLTIIITFFDMVLKDIKIRDIVNKEIIFLGIFYLISLISGLFTSPNILLHLDTFITSFMFFIIMICMMYYETDENKKGKVMLIIYLITIISLITLFVSPIVYKDTVIESNIRFSISKELNVNTLGMYFSLGIWISLYYVTISKKYNLILYIIIGLFLYGILLTGSRKNLISSVLIISLWILFVKFLMQKNKILYFTLLIIIISMFLLSFDYIYTDFGIFTRFEILIDELLGNTDSARIDMYVYGLELFENKPILGYGLQGFLYFYGMYSHSTFIEVLVSTGIIGSFFYFGFFIYSILKNIFLIVKTNKILKMKENYKFRMCLILWMNILFMSIGVIHMYILISFVSFSILLSALNPREKYNSI